MVFETMAGIIRDYKGGDGEAVTPETTFEELGLDSLDRVELVMNFEEKFKIQLELDQNLCTVGDLALVVEEKLREKGEGA